MGRKKWCPRTADRHSYKKSGSKHQVLPKATEVIHAEGTFHPPCIMQLKLSGLSMKFDLAYQNFSLTSCKSFEIKGARIQIVLVGVLSFLKAESLTVKKPPCLEAFLALFYTLMHSKSIILSAASESQTLSQQGFMTVMERVAAMNPLTICRQWLLVMFCRSLALLAASLLQDAGCCSVVYLKAVSPCTCQYLLTDSQE